MRRWVIVAGAAIVVLILVGVLSVDVKLQNPLVATGKPFWETPLDSETPLPDALVIWVRLAREVKPAVANVSVTAGGRGLTPREEFFRRFFEGVPERRRQSVGSGFAISQDGYVVTNNHVVQNASEVTVRFAGLGERQARIVGTDVKTDIALLKVEGNGIPVIPLGDSDALEVGEAVMAVGNPFGLEQTVTTGIVSAKERFIGSGPFDDFIQTDASINPGNSGGPLVDARGAVVGINTAIFSQTGGSVGIGFAIPINLAKDVLLQLRDAGRVVRGYLGVSVVPVTEDVLKERRLPSRQGAMVAEVSGRSPAASAGLKAGDVIVAFGGRDVSDPLDLTRRVAGTSPGTRTEVTVVRDGARRKIEVTLGQLPERPDQ
jgi:serine protease Do